jgi:1-acyl-sn-glycerol-3-phosphate acyltransferase
MERLARSAKTLRRNRAWLPVAELDAHPLGTWVLEMAFDQWLRAFYRREAVFPDGFRIESGTLIASNHQRDVDGPMLGTVLARRRGLRFEWPLPFYATREDLFRAGILARLTVHWPKPLSALLGRLSLGWFFPLGRTEPIRRVREFTLGEALQALRDAGCGNDDCSSLLNARGQRELGVTPATALRIASARADPAVLEQWWGLRRLTPAALAQIAPAFRATMAAQLAHFARRLEHGHCVYFAPEGGISMDGHFSRIRAGFFHLCRGTSVPPWIQPVALSYDALAAGRLRAVIHVGRRYRADPALDRRGFDASLRRAVLALEAVTPSHWLARFLLHGPLAFTRDQLADWFERGQAMLRASGAALDPLWARLPASSLADLRLRWLLRKGLIVRDGDGFRNICPRDAPPSWRSPANVVRYLDNSLSDLLPGAGPMPPC